MDSADEPEGSAQDEERVEEAKLAISAPDVEWRGEGPACTPGVPCTITGGSYVGLKNTFVDQYVVHSERRYGINLGWRSGANPGNVRFVPQAGGAVRYGEPVALFVTNPSAEKYVKYREREYGINLVWSPDAVYQWRITGGAPGTPVDLNQPFGLSNDVQTHVVYCPREYGINLRWNADCPYR
ncbi:hypothetical protein WME79_08215 [Sorangium sp. So ce726]|uniref:hypothetical protein n=1 Tax=Sorangium sp. So ce726 TaxID=3133319 RepID=UPI003F61047C